MNYRKMLQQGICKVKFIKGDGSERTMRCTLNTDYIDQHKLTPMGSGNSGPIEQIRCVDVDKNGWRSFNVDRVISFEQESLVVGTSVQ